MTHRKAIYCQALAAVLFSTSGLLIKVISVAPLPLLGVRGAFAALTIALYMTRPFLPSAPRPASTGPRPARARTRLNFRLSLPQLGGAMSFVGAQAFFIIAVRETTAANAIFLQYTAPVFVALFRYSLPPRTCREVRLARSRSDKRGASLLLRRWADIRWCSR